MFRIHDLPQAIKAHKLSQEEYNQIQTILGREPNIVELGIFSAMWSEHCSYKSSKKYLKGFPVEAKWVIQGPGENAGVIDITQGYAAVFKMESHNHPSFIEPYAGAATGVGGIMRDIFTMGARPVASLNSIRFGELHRSDTIGKRHRYLLRGVVKGIGDYGNCMGVPTVGGEISVEDCYNGNILVNAFTLGIAKSDEIFYGKAEGIGNPVMYVGSKTGRDGLGGAVMSSDSFNENSASLRPTVQMGDPFTEKLLLEACLELFKQDLIIGIQDMGAAGLTSSSFEMAGRSGSGMKLYLDKVPMREEGMNPYELMLSESQERMLICAKKGCEQQILEIFKKWELDCAIIGEVCSGGQMELYWHNELCANIPIQPLSEASPLLDRPIQKPQYLQDIQKEVKPDALLKSQDIFEKLWGSLEVASKEWVYEQYDSSVQANTFIDSGEGDSSLIRVKENGVGLALSVGCDPRLCYLDPKEGAKRAVAKCALEIAVRGATPLALTDCLNFGSPENPEVMWQFKEACEGIKEAASYLETPVISGNVSLYNRSDDVEIYPTPSIAMVGLINNPSDALKAHLKQAGNSLYLLGHHQKEWAGSLYQKIILKELCGTLKQIDLQKAKQLQQCLIQGVNKKLFESAKEVGYGGVAITLAKMAILGNKGFSCKMTHDLLFSESPSLAIVEVHPSNQEAFLQLTQTYELSCIQIGQVIQQDHIDFGEMSFSLQQLKQVYHNSFTQVATRL